MKFELDKAAELLAATPASLAALLGNLSDDWTASDGNRDDWTPYDVVGHLVHADETDWIPRARVILAQGADRRFPEFDRYGQFEKADGRSLSELLELFATRRAECLATLRSWNLTDEQLALTGVHAEFGEVTLAQLLATWVVHDLTHVRQIATNLAKKYQTEVGPWSAYLSILKG